MKRYVLLCLCFILIIGTGYAQLENYSSECIESDSGLDYYVKGTTSYNGFDYEDHCVSSDAVVNEGKFNEYRLNAGDLIEYACYYPENTPRCYSTACPFIQYHCPGGCEDGACKRATQSNETVEGDVVMEVDEKDLCPGCLVDEVCYPAGYRKGQDYCSDDLEFTEQRKDRSFCKNNFECESNVCMEGVCVKGTLIQRIVNFFERLLS